jgi:hypothetical protein
MGQWSPGLVRKQSNGILYNTIILESEIDPRFKHHCYLESVAWLVAFILTYTDFIDVLFIRNCLVAFDGPIVTRNKCYFKLCLFQESRDY